MSQFILKETERLKWDITVGYTNVGAVKELKFFGLSEAEANYLLYKVRIQNQISSVYIDNDFDVDYITLMSKAYGRTLTVAEAEEIWKDQYNTMSGTADFAHYNITMATITAPDVFYVPKKFLELTIGGKEKLKDMAGWLGDATIYKVTDELGVSQSLCKPSN